MESSFSSSTGNPWFAVSMGLAGIIVGFAIASAQGTPAGAPSAPIAQQPGDTGTVPVPPPTNDTPADADDDPFKGGDDATITLVEFTDYQCPFCSRHYDQTMPQIMSEYVDTGKVKYVVRDFPLGFHANAQKSAEASECADEQGQFWPMHDLLFENQQAWSNVADPSSTFKGYAGQLGLNQGDFDSCLDNGDMSEEVQADLAAGSASGIDGTPGFWILGPDGVTKKISGAYPFETFKAAFDEML